MAEYQGLLEGERREHKRAIDRLEAKVAELERRRADNPYENDAARWNGANTAGTTIFKDINSNTKVTMH
jgi:hypothetical protein